MIVKHFKIPENTSLIKYLFLNLLEIPEFSRLVKCRTKMGKAQNERFFSCECFFWHSGVNSVFYCFPARFQPKIKVGYPEIICVCDLIRFVRIDGVRRGVEGLVHFKKIVSLTQVIKVFVVVENNCLFFRSVTLIFSGLIWTFKRGFFWSFFEMCVIRSQFSKPVFEASFQPAV